MEEIESNLIEEILTLRKGSPKICDHIAGLNDMVVKAKAAHADYPSDFPVEQFLDIMSSQLVLLIGDDNA
jgi:hypothetical protein